MTDKILRPLTAFERRMIELAKQFPPPTRDPLAHAAILRRAEGDIAVRLRAKAIMERMPSFMLTRMMGGSKFPMSEALRGYFHEYQHRLTQFGPDSFPSSFNVIEGFLNFSHEFMAFDIREEREHLLHLDDYIDWYTGQTFPNDHRILIDVCEEGINYTYNMVEPTQSYRVQVDGADLVIIGISMVRHSAELSLFAVVGESPPHPSNAELTHYEMGETVVPERAGIIPDSSLDFSARYLPEAPGFGRVIALGRFDLTARSFDVRYINVDVGPSYMVFTDDPMLRGVDSETFENVERMLGRYDSLFALIVSAVYLPVFFLAESDRAVSTKFATDLEAERSSPRVRSAVKLIGEPSIPFMREVRCLAAGLTGSGEPFQTLDVADFVLSSSGFWKTLAPTQVGEDSHGNPILGKTWVERTEFAPSRSLSKFVVAKPPIPVQGNDPGTLYVVRSAAHGADMYKIGLTRRDTHTRISELSRATGVPVPFEALASWQVGDVGKLERDVHARLAQYRVSARREFFLAPLSVIIASIEVAIKADP